MICPQCKTANDDEYVFCVNCGISIGGDPYSTVKFDPRTQAPVTREQLLPETVFVKKAPFRPKIQPEYQRETTFDRYHDRPRSKMPIFFGAVLGLIVIAGAGVFAVFRLTAVPAKTEVLPEHLGFFAQNDDRTRLAEIRRRDHLNVFEARNALVTEVGLQAVNDHPDFILYAEGTEVPLNELKVVKIDTLTDDGRVRIEDFEASLIDAKPAMKRIRFKRSLENGRYAFALISGFANEGNHKLWPFEVRGSTTPAWQSGIELTLQVKPPEPPAAVVPKASEELAAVPEGATVASVKGKDVWLRKAANLEKRSKLEMLAPRQKVIVIRYSEHFTTWNGLTDKWALVQTDKGKQGWVFNALLDHGQN